MMLRVEREFLQKGISGIFDAIFYSSLICQLPALRGPLFDTGNEEGPFRVYELIVISPAALLFMAAPLLVFFIYRREIAFRKKIIFYLSVTLVFIITFFVLLKTAETALSVNDHTIELITPWYLMLYITELSSALLKECLK